LIIKVDIRCLLLPAKGEKVDWAGMLDSLDNGYVTFSAHMQTI